MDVEEARKHEPKVVFVDGKNRIAQIDKERAGPQMPRKLEIVH
jgi:aspartate 1-decarboxylase